MLKLLSSVLLFSVVAANFGCSKESNAIKPTSTVAYSTADKNPNPGAKRSMPPPIPPPPSQ